MAFTLQEIEDNIKKYTELKKKTEEKISKLIENPEFKRMQNGVDSVETHDIKNVYETLKMIINDCDTEIDRLNRLKLTTCEKKGQRSKLWSNFYGY